MRFRWLSKTFLKLSAKTTTAAILTVCNCTWVFNGCRANIDDWMPPVALTWSKRAHWVTVVKAGGGTLLQAARRRTTAHLMRRAAASAQLHTTRTTLELVSSPSLNGLSSHSCCSTKGFSLAYLSENRQLQLIEFNSYFQSLKLPVNDYSRVSSLTRRPIQLMRFG